MKALKAQLNEVYDSIGFQTTFKKKKIETHDIT